MTARIQIDTNGPLEGVIPNPLMRFLRLEEGTGDCEMAADFSEVAGSFCLIPPEHEIWVVTHLIWLLEVADGPLVANKYGDQSALSSGILFRYQRAGELIDLLDGLPIKNNANLARHLGQATTPVIVVPATAEIALTHGMFRIPDLGLDGNAGDCLEVVIQDDLSGLVSQTVKAIGYKAIER